MKARAALGWQTSLADLSLILFMLTAAALAAHNQKADEDAPTSARRPSPRAEPLAVYAPGPDAPPLREWLAQQAPDPRQQVTITLHYGPAPGARDAALRDAVRLLGEAGAAGARARLVVEPGEGPANVALAYDLPGQADAAAADGTGLAALRPVHPPRNP